MEDKKDTQNNSAMEESENEGASQNSNSDSTPSSSTLSTSEVSKINFLSLLETLQCFTFS